MGTIERKEREKEEMKQAILNAARKILKKDGIDNISIRKIADMIDYSPGIIYHYFEKKEEIIEKLILEDYLKIIQVLMPLYSDTKPPEKKIEEGLKVYIKLVSKMGEEYTNIMLNDSSEILSYTSVLKQGSYEKRKALSMITCTLFEIPRFLDKSKDEVERISQIIWSLAFGLAMRLNIEKIGEEQQEKLVNEALQMIHCIIENI